MATQATWKPSTGHGEVDTAKWTHRPAKSCRVGNR